MIRSLAQSARYWVAGTLVAFAGVAATRLLAPAFGQPQRACIAAAGEVIAIAGLGILILGVNRRLRRLRNEGNSPPV